MLAEDRLNAIVSMVQQAGSVTVPELAEALGVTASTIRRDLQTLNRAHRIAKVHGGATSLERAHVTRDLTISERSALCRIGAMFCLRRQGEGPGFEVNLDSVARSSLRISPKVLQLARTKAAP